MSDELRVTIDGRAVGARRGQTILEAATAAGIYIPRLCWMAGLTPAGSCRVCTVRINGRAQAACTQPAADGMVIENDSDELRALRRDLIDMLFVEGNHFCMFCERSGNCELQALAYRFGITAPRYPLLSPARDLDASHPQILLDRNRCILCGRCVRAAAQLDGTHALGFRGRGADKHVAAAAPAGLAATAIAAGDRAVAACPTGALLRKRVGYAVPVGRRAYDARPIGSDVAHEEGP